MIVKSLLSLLFLFLLIASSFADGFMRDDYGNLNIGKRLFGINNPLEKCVKVEINGVLQTDKKLYADITLNKIKSSGYCGCFIASLTYKTIVYDANSTQLSIGERGDIKEYKFPLTQRFLFSNNISTFKGDEFFSFFITCTRLDEKDR